MSRNRIACTVAVLLLGCSQDAALRKDVEELRSDTEQQQRTLATIEKAVQEKEAENKELARKLAAAESRMEHVARRPTFTVEEPTITFQRTTSPLRSDGKSVDVILQSVSVDSTKPNGGVWDESGPPDLKVRLETSDDVFVSETKQDTHSTSYGVKALRIAEGDTLEITVIDGDVFVDDTIGEYTKLITAETIRQGTVTWSFDRVDQLVLRFEP
jgi:cell division protein FtsB